MTSIDCVKQRSVPIIIAQIYLDSFEIQQSPHGLGVTFVWSNHQGSLTLVIRRIGKVLSIVVD